MDTFAPILRIISRYGLGGLAAWGALSTEQVTFLQTLAADPDVVMVVSLVGAAVVELWYQWAKRTGGET